MNVNPKSLKNLKPGANRKDAVRVTLTLKPETVKLLKMTGNMSQAVDKFIELIKQGCVQHDGMLNPLPPRSEPKKLESPNAHSENEAIALPCQEENAPYPIKPAYWTEVLTRKGMIERGFSAHRLDNMPRDTTVRDGYGRLWWKETIGKNNESLRPLGSRAESVWCR